MKVKVTVSSQQGYCKNGLKKGNSFYISEKEIEGQICIHALYSMLPKAFAMLYNAKFPWVTDTVTHACPDAHNPVTFTLEAIE